MDQQASAGHGLLHRMRTISNHFYQ